MPTFQYRAYYSTGVEVCDTTEAASMAEVEEWLRSYGLEVHEIEALRPIPNTNQAPPDDRDARAEPAPSFMQEQPQERRWVRYSDSLDKSVDKSIDRSIDRDADDHDAFTSAWYLRTSDLAVVRRGTRSGDRALTMLETLLSRRISFQAAVSDLAASGFRGSVGHAFAGLAVDVSGGTSMLEAMRRHRRLFGDMSIEYLRLGELNFGVSEALRQYLQMRHAQRSVAGPRPCAAFCGTTRRFALAFAGAQALSGDVLGSLRCAAIELRRPLRTRVAMSLRSLREGQFLADALPARSLFRAGFEPAFIGLVRAGQSHSALPEVLRLAAWA